MWRKRHKRVGFPDSSRGGSLEVVGGALLGTYVARVRHSADVTRENHPGAAMCTQSSLSIAVVHLELLLRRQGTVWVEGTSVLCALCRRAVFQSTAKATTASVYSARNRVKRIQLLLAVVP